MTATIDDVVEAMNFVSWDGGLECEAYLRLEDMELLLYAEDGDFDPLPEDVGDETKYVAIPDKRDLDLGRQLVLNFVREFLPNDIERVYEYFRKRGAYSRFKDLVESRGVLERWYAYEANAMREAVIQWCGDNNLKIEGIA